MASLSLSRNHPSRQTTSLSTVRLAVLLATSFALGLAVCSAFLLWHTHANDPIFHDTHGVGGGGGVGAGVNGPPPRLYRPPPDHIEIMKRLEGGGDNVNNVHTAVAGAVAGSSSSSSDAPLSILDGLRVLVAIASYDFMQLPHLEEVLDGFLDLCYAGSMVDIVVHTTVLYPVALIDMLNDRMRCHNPSPNAGLTLTLVLKPPRVRLHLVDFHRTLFYDRIDRYDLFIYTEDDIRISPKTAAAYLHETRRVSSIVGPSESSDFNVGIVRYEYDFPENVVITDKTRHATENVTRVYWEHLGKPIFEKTVDEVEDPRLKPYYVGMHLHHQGMYLATRDLLKAWKVRKGCDFATVRDRPSHPNKRSQPTEGTQRVWMSSQMLYGGRHCKVHQLLPVENFGQLTLLHLPNKNYRRVGKQGRIGGYSENATKNEFSDGTEQFTPSHPDLLSSMELHIEIKRQFPELKTTNVVGRGGVKVYNGIKMIDDDFVYGQLAKNHRTAAEKMMEQYRAYVQRGGYMVEEDLNLEDGWRNQN